MTTTGTRARFANTYRSNHNGVFTVSILRAGGYDVWMWEASDPKETRLMRSFELSAYGNDQETCRGVAAEYARTLSR